MKKILVVAVMAVCALTANAQTSEVGKITLTPQVGYVLSGGYKASTNIVGDESHTLETTSNAGYRFGAELGIQATKWFKPSVGVFYTHSGLDVKYAGSKIGDATMNYVNVPIMANFYVFNGLALKIGIQPSFLASAKESTYSGGSMDAKEDMKSFDFQIPVGVSYEFHNVVLDVRANISTSTFLKDGKGIKYNELLKLDDLRNDMLVISLGYKFELN